MRHFSRTVTSHFFNALLTPAVRFLSIAREFLAVLLAWASLAPFVAWWRRHQGQASVPREVRAQLDAALDPSATAAAKSNDLAAVREWLREALGRSARVTAARILRPRT